MSRYVAGKDTSHTHKGRDCQEELLKAIEECEDEWCNDPAYKDVLYKLDKIEQELDNLQSPGRREVLRAGLPKHSGQEPSDIHSEAPMEVQRTVVQRASAS